MSTESVFFTLTGARIEQVEFGSNVGAFTGTKKTYIVQGDRTFSYIW